MEISCQSDTSSFFSNCTDDPMNRIAQLGDEIIKVQKRLGVNNGDNLCPGLSNQELSISPLSEHFPSDSEIHCLYRWRNGGRPDTPMGNLWIVPGFYFLS